MTADASAAPLPRPNATTDGGGDRAIDCGGDIHRRREGDAGDRRS